VKSVTIQFTNLTYAWHEVSVSPITIAYTYSENFSNFNIATATAETLYFNQFFSLSLTPTAINQWLLLAIRTDESSGGHLSANVLVSPFLLTPDSILESTVNRYAGAFQSYIFLYSPEYTPITLSTAVSVPIKL
jgi:singapore isolate B (sub-type 7) whole genome shotgun sequence assembly, scaffold_14